MDLCSPSVSSASTLVSEPLIPILMPRSFVYNNVLCHFCFQKKPSLAFSMENTAVSPASPMANFMATLTALPTKLIKEIVKHVSQPVRGETFVHNC